MADHTDIPTRSPRGFLDIESVVHHRVTKTQPPSSNATAGLDYERCAVLHNAILKHGWRASGHNVVEMPRTPWWEAEWNRPHLAQVEQRLHPSLVEFLKRAMVTPPVPDSPVDNSLFYFCPDLAPLSEFLKGGMYEYADEGLVCLYSSGDFKGDFMDGIV